MPSVDTDMASPSGAKLPIKGNPYAEHLPLQSSVEDKYSICALWLRNEAEPLVIIGRRNMQINA
jgi:hypothetical protein